MNSLWGFLRRIQKGFPAKMEEEEEKKKMETFNNPR